MRGRRENRANTRSSLRILQLLKLFNANSETPYLLWDNGTRAELTEYVEGQQEKLIKTVRND